MSPNIDAAEVRLWLSELSTLTGEREADAVREAVRERPERVTRENDESLADRLLAIGRDCAARLKEPYRSAGHGERRYDQRGMPPGTETDTGHAPAQAVHRPCQQEPRGEDDDFPVFRVTPGARPITLEDVKRLDDS